MSADITTREGLFAVMRQHAAEREAAKPIVAELLQREELPWDEPIPEEWKTAGFVEELTKGANLVLDADPALSVSYAHLALAICGFITPALDPELIPDRTRAMVFRTLGMAYRLLSAFPESERALRHALSTAQNHEALLHDRATILYALAGTFTQDRSGGEIDELLREAQQLFKELKDERSDFRCDLIRGVFAIRRGDLVRSHDVFKSLADRVVEVDDAFTQGVVFNDLGVVLQRLGRFDEAIASLERALKIYQEAQVPLEADRVRWTLAVTRIEKGEIEENLPELQQVRSIFLSREMLEEAGLIALDIADALIATGRPEEARLVIEEALAEFEHSGLPSELTTAMAYLRDVSHAPRARKAIRHVRAFFARASSERSVIFAPLPEHD